MERHSELFYAAKNNHKKLENIDKNRKEHTFYTNETENDSFSNRMIGVMLVLVAVMFLKQTGILNENEAYQSAMTEIHRQVTAEEVESTVKNHAIYPIMNWIDGTSVPE